MGQDGQCNLQAPTVPPNKALNQPYNTIQHDDFTSTLDLSQQITCAHCAANQTLAATFVEVVHPEMKKMIHKCAEVHRFI